MVDIVKLPRKLQDFRSIVRKRMVLDKEKEELFYTIPEEIWQNILVTNFKDNLEYARRVILDKKEIIESLDDMLSNKEKLKIDNLSYVSDKIMKSLDDKEHILFITDYDNDGSLSQAIIEQFINIEKQALADMSRVHVEYARTVEGNGSRGFTLELVEDLVKEKNIDVSKPFLLITADNGINSLVEQKRIQEKFVNASIIITDHHEPEHGMLVEENEKTIIFNPKYKAIDHQTQEMLKERGNANKKAKDYEFFDKYNISGATTVGVLLKNILEKRYVGTSVENTSNYINGLKTISQLSKVSNVLDYVDTSPEDKLYASDEISKYVGIQSLLNINNSMSKFITEKEILNEVNVLKETIPELDKEKVIDIHKNIQVLNKYAQIILSLIKDFEDDKNDAVINMDKANLVTKKNDYGFVNNYLQMISAINYFDKESVDFMPVEEAFVRFLENDLQDVEVAKFDENTIKLAIEDKMFNRLFTSNNTNYIEQLRPYIFSYMANDNKGAYEDAALKQALRIFESLRKEEKSLMEELRKGLVFENIEKENVSILLMNKDLTGLINRKLVNKTYNNANNGFYLVLDNVSLNKISGSFRSLYDIEDILNNESFKDLLKKYEIKIETPGHKRAAGFIMSSEKEIKNPVNIIQEIAEIFNKQIKNLKQNDLSLQNFIESDVFNVGFINDFNKTIRGNIPHYKNISPVIKLHEDFVYVNQKTNLQMSLENYVKDHKYGYVSLLLELPKHGEEDKNLIIPVELLRKIINSGKDENGYYNLFAQMNYLDNGLFMVSNIVEKNKVQNALELKQNLEKYKIVDEAYKDKKLDNVVNLSRDELKSSPFFKYGRYGEVDFNLFENMIIGILDYYNLDCYTTFDVEATGFSNAKMLNLGTVNYIINEANAFEISKETYENQMYKSIKNNKYLLKEIEKIHPLNKKEYLDLLNKGDLKNIYYRGENGEKEPFYYDGEIEKINNVILKDDKYVINREIEATTLSRLIKEEDFKMPIYMSYLTGVNNEHLNKYGKTLLETDNFFSDYYKGKKVMIGAHNTPYDIRIARANTSRFYDEVLLNRDNKLFDSCRFSKKSTLAYDNMSMASFSGIPEIPENVLFNNNSNSKLNLVSFLNKKVGQYPDRTGDYRLSFENGELYLIKYGNKIEKTKISKTDYQEMAKLFKSQPESDEVKKKSKAKKKDQEPTFEERMMADQDVGEYSFNGNLKIHSKLPLNSIKYSAQALADQKMIRNLLLDDQEFKVNVITDFSGYVHLERLKTLLIEFQHTYRFDKSFAQNVMDQNLINHFLNPEEEVELMKFQSDFMEKNKELSACFHDSWYYKAILNVKDPEYKDLNNETYEIISNQTGFSTEIIKEVLTKAYEFKKKYNIQNLLQPEIHVNGPINGDVLFETPLTLTMLATKTMNNSINSREAEYSNLEKPLLIFRKESEEFTINTYLNKEERDVSEDSMGYTQLLNYNRENLSSLAKEKQTLHSLLNESEENVIRFGLGSNVLQPDTHIVAITKRPLDVETVREDSKKIAYLMQVKQSYSTGEASVNKLLDANVLEMEKIKKELNKNYRYLELSSAVKELGSINEYIYEKDASEYKSDLFVKLLDKVEDISLYQFEKKLLEVNLLIDNIRKGLNVSEKFSENAENDLIKLISLQEILEQKIESMKAMEEKTDLEIAFENQGYDYLAKDECLERNVKRLQPTKYMFTHFDLLKMTGEYIKSKYDRDYALELKQAIQIKNNKQISDPKLEEIIDVTIEKEEIKTVKRTQRVKKEG